MKRNYRNPKASENYRAWLEHPETIPFSFVYGGKEYSGFSSGYFILQEKKTDTAGDKE